jgi:hypothetical protein
VLILNDFKSFVPEVLILLDLKSFRMRAIQEFAKISEVLILGGLGDGKCTNGWI